MDKFKLFFWTIVLLICLVFIIIPRSSDISDYKYEIKIFHDSKIDVREYYRKLRKKKKHTLILTMTDNSSWSFSKEYSKYWKVLADKNNKGKKFKLYFPEAMIKYNNPARVEIEDEIIYDLNENQLYKNKYPLLGLILILLFLSYKIFAKIETPKKGK